METVQRKTFLAGNWKSNGTRLFTNQRSDYLTTLKFNKQKIDIAICLPYIHLQSAKIFLTGDYQISAQNLSMYTDGPYTGEISAKQLKDIGIEWSIIGHSERRFLFNESEKVIAEKLKRAFEQKMFAIVCVGGKNKEVPAEVKPAAPEKKEEAPAQGGEANPAAGNENAEKKEEAKPEEKPLSPEEQMTKSIETVINQLNTIIETSKDFWDHLVICYEPINIQTGKEMENIQKEKIQEIFNKIRDLIKEKVGEPYAKSTRIIYGGNITVDSSKEFIALKDIDGFLVSDISLQDEFKDIVDIVENKVWN